MVVIESSCSSEIFIIICSHFLRDCLLEVKGKLVIWLCPTILVCDLRNINEVINAAVVLLLNLLPYCNDKKPFNCVPKNYPFQVSDNYSLFENEFLKPNICIAALKKLALLNMEGCPVTARCLESLTGMYCVCFLFILVSMLFQVC